MSLYTGFGEGNQQHRVNGLSWGLDNWIYCANGDSGGTIKSLKTGTTINISGRDLRIRPDDGATRSADRATAVWPQPRRLGQLVRLQQQQSDVALRAGRSLHPPQSARRRARAARADVSVTPGAVAGLSRSAARCRASTIRTSANHFTSACSAIVYRDELFGPGVRGQHVRQRAGP